MHMWFWLDTNLGTFLFPGYNITTIWGFICTCLGVAALAVLYEGMKLMQIKLQHNMLASLPQSASTSSENSSLLTKISARSVKTSPSMRCASWYKWLIQVLHWSVHTILGYLLMMAVMTYNGYIGIAIVIGGSLGYWIFGPSIVRLNMARYYDIQKSIQCDKECRDSFSVSVNRERRESAVSAVAEQLVTKATVEVHTTSKTEI